MALQAAGEASNTLSYAEATGRASYVVPKDDGINAGRAYAENTQVEAAAKPDAATKRHEWAAKENDTQIKSGQDTQKVGNGIAMAGSVIAAIGGAIAIFGGPVGVVVGAVVALIGAIIGIIGGVVSAVGQGQVEEATGEKNAHLDQVNKGVNDAQSAGEQAKMLNKKNQIDAYRQKESSLNHEIAKQEEYMKTLDPDSKKFQSAQKDLERMNSIKGQYEGRISEYEASASGQGTIPPTADAPPAIVDPALSMTTTSSTDADTGTTTSTTTDVSSNPSGTTTTASAASAPPPTTTTTVAAPVQ